jgi:hypothetical protein
MISTPQDRRLILLLAFLAIALMAKPSLAQPGDPPGGKYALVIGNSTYPGRDSISGAEDAKTMKDYLEQQLGFQPIESIVNANLDTMKAALDRFILRISKASVVVFFYSGHGFQINQKNYLLPTDGSIDPDHPERALSVEDKVLPVLAQAPDDAVKLVFLDACRKGVVLPSGITPGFAKPSGIPKKTVLAFAASYGELASSGPANGLSPYSTALLSFIRTPGLELGDLLKMVHERVLFNSRGIQEPREEGLDSVGQFFLRDAVTVNTVIGKPSTDDSNALLVLVNGKIVVDSSRKNNGPIVLKAGEGESNDLILLVSNGKTYHNGHTWDRTEGWSYKITFTAPGNANAQPFAADFSDDEPVPFKDGPHHGKVFTVARARLLVNPATAEVTLSEREDGLGNSEAPFFAQDQDALVEEKVKDLPLDQILVPSKFPDLGDLSATFLIPLFRELLTTGKLIGQDVADPERTFFVVRGNKALRDFVGSCVKDNLKDRIDDFQASVKAALKRDPTPFKLFDANLSECVKNAAKGTSLPPDDVKVWTAIEDRSDEPLTGAPPVAAGQGGQP